MWEKQEAARLRLKAEQEASLKAAQELSFRKDQEIARMKAENQRLKEQEAARLKADQAKASFDEASEEAIYPDEPICPDEDDDPVFIYLFYHC